MRIVLARFGFLVDLLDHSFDCTLFAFKDSINILEVFFLLVIRALLCLLVSFIFRGMN